MKNLALHFSLAVFVAGAWASDVAAQTPLFELKVLGILDSDFNTKPCPSCGFGPGSGAKVLPLGEALAGDTLIIRAFASGWDAEPTIGACTNGEECRLFENDCRGFHCSDTNQPCFPDEMQCNLLATCIPDTCNTDPAVGSFQWTLDKTTLGSAGPGLITLAEQSCDPDACFECQDNPFDEGGPDGLCNDCSCFHGVLFACFGQCTCCPGGPAGGLACPADTGICEDSSAAFIDTTNSDWILSNSAPTIAVFPANFEWIGTTQGTVGAAEGAFPSYMGTVLLTLPTCGGGQYSINFIADEDKTFLNDPNAVKLPAPDLDPVVINLAEVPDPCDGVDCSDGDLCTVDTCNNESCGAVCDHKAVSCDPIDFVCNSLTGVCENVRGACCTDDGTVCDEITESTCDGRGGTFQGIGTECDDLLTICGTGGTGCETLTADFPPDCAIDARQPHDINDAAALQGWDAIDVLVGPVGCELTTGDLVVDVVPSGAALGVLSVNQVGNVATIAFETIIPARNWTCVSLSGLPGQQACVGNLPGDVDGGGSSNPALDLSARIDCANNPGTCEPWQEDTDRDGSPGVLDITRVIDLFNGAGQFNSWTGASFDGNLCPSAP